MEYFKLLHLAREPFSNSPDPAFFYESVQHKDCLQKLEIALRLRRGLNVVTGVVGTGKTTLCRQLIQSLSGDPAVSASLLLDPDFPDPRTFLNAVVQTITGRRPADDDTMHAMKEQLKHYLFQKGVEEDLTLVLIVDEGQKMAPACLETLRELLNFETNEYKLFQVVIFAQSEFAEILENIPNLADRVNLYYRLGPLNFKDTRALIGHRLRLAGRTEASKPRLFSLPALWRLFHFSGGYPRKIVHLCHQCLLAMIIQNKTRVTRRMVGACARRTFVRPRIFRPVSVGITLLILAAVGLGVWQYAGGPRKTEAPAQGKIGHQFLATITAGNPDEDIRATQPAPAETTALNESPATDGGNPTAVKPEPPAAGTTEILQPIEPVNTAAGEENIPDLAPSTLGNVRVAVGDTLGELIQWVYGTYTYRHHQAVLQANPWLTDPDRLRAGQTLVFPALFEDTETMPAATWWVSIARASTLEDALAKIREKAADGLPLRLLTRWRPQEGMSFHIVLKTCFENRQEAEFERERTGLSDPALSELIYLEKADDIVFGTPVTPGRASIQELNGALQLHFQHHKMQYDSFAVS